MSEMKPVGWLYEVKVPETNSWINAATAYEPIAETGRRRNVQPLYTADQLAEAVAAERDGCLRIVMSEGITPSIPDDPDPVAEAINGALQNVHEAIRSAAK